MFKIEIDPTKLNQEQFDYALKFLQEFPVTWERRVKEQRFGVEPTGEVIKAYTGPESVVAQVQEPDADGVVKSSECEVDDAGLPWDERIHSSNHKFSKDGTWQYRRGVDKALVKKVEAELFALMQQPSPTAASPMAPPPPAAVPPAPPAPANAPPVAPPPPVQSQAKVPDYYVDPTQGMVHSQPAVLTKSPNDVFIEMVGRAMGAIAQGKANQAEIDGICMKYSVPNMNMLITRQDICIAACTEINNMLAQRGA